LIRDVNGCHLENFNDIITTPPEVGIYKKIETGSSIGILLQVSIFYSEADFEVFRPAGATHCTDGVKFGMEQGTPCQISPHRCNDKGVGPPKLKFLLRFDQNVEYTRPAGPYSLRDFHKICRVCTPFQNALAVKIWLDLLEGLWSYGGETGLTPGHIVSDGDSSPSHKGHSLPIFDPYLLWPNGWMDQDATW